jgi:hypothetical protein
MFERLFDLQERTINSLYNITTKINELTNMAQRNEVLLNNVIQDLSKTERKFELLVKILIGFIILTIAFFVGFNILNK